MTPTPQDFSAFVMFVGALLVAFGFLWLIVEFLWPMVFEGPQTAKDKRETSKSSPYRPIPTADKKVQMKITSKEEPRVAQDSKESQPNGTATDHEAVGEALARIAERNTWLANQAVHEDIISGYLNVIESIEVTISATSDFTSPTIGDSDAGSYSGTSSSYDSGSDSGSSWSDSSSSYDSGGSSSDW